MLVWTMSVSFENRFTMRPRGVVSKKDIGHRITQDNSPLWRLLDATILPNAIESARPSSDIPEKQQFGSY